MGNILTKEIPQNIVLKEISDQSQVGRTVILEGPPIYLYPGRSSHLWDHPGFVQGWVLAEQVAERLSGASETKLARWSLLDDFNNKPEGVTGSPKASTAIEGISSANPTLGGLDVFKTIPEDFEQGRGHWESEFFDGVRACDHLDSGFQIIKLTDSLNLAMLKGREVLEALDPLPLILVIHPTDFRRQQEAMLTQLLGRMRQQPYLDKIYSRLPIPERKKLVSETYMHVWMGDLGEITSVTQPVWDQFSGRFLHQSIRYDQP